MNKYILWRRATAIADSRQDGPSEQQQKPQPSWRPSMWRELKWQRRVERGREEEVHCEGLAEYSVPVYWLTQQTFTSLRRISN